MSWELRRRCSEAMAGLLACVCVWSFFVLRADCACAAVAKIDWRRGLVLAMGRGLPGVAAYDIDLARSDAEQEARKEVVRQIYTVLERTWLSDSLTVGQQLSRHPELRPLLDAYMNKFKVLDTRYFSDGGVELTGALLLDGTLLEVLMPSLRSKSGKSQKRRKSVKIKIPTVVVDARHLGLSPGLAPRIFDTANKLVFGLSMLPESLIRQQRVVRYERDARVLSGSQSKYQKSMLWIHAQRLAKSGVIDIVITKKDAKRLGSLTAQGIAGNLIILWKPRLLSAVSKELG